MHVYVGVVHSCYVWYIYIDVVCMYMHVGLCMYLCYI